MRITLYTDYSLRVLIYLAVKPEGLSTIKEIADSYGISKNHLMKVVHYLQLQGHIETVRGKNGGLRLHRPPEEINIGSMIRATEQDMTLTECFGDRSQCIIEPACGLKHVLVEALEAFFEVLDRYTLADLLKPAERRQLGELLSLGGIPIRLATPAPAPAAAEPVPPKAG